MRVGASCDGGHGHCQIRIAAFGFGIQMVKIAIALTVSMEVASDRNATVLSYMVTAVGL